LFLSFSSITNYLENNTPDQSETNYDPCVLQYLTTLQKLNQLEEERKEQKLNIKVCKTNTAKMKLYKAALNPDNQQLQQQLPSQLQQPPPPQQQQLQPPRLHQLIIQANSVNRSFRKEFEVFRRKWKENC